MESKTKNNSKINSYENHLDHNKQIANIFIEEFNDCFHNILVISQTDFIKKFIHRVNSIIKSYYPFLLNTLRKDKTIFPSNFNTIFNEYYLPTKTMSEKFLNSNEKKQKLSKFQKHCELNEKPFHSCLGEFFLTTDENGKEFIICSKCKYIYNSNNILMYCSSHDTDFYSKATHGEEEKLLPATWQKYHCPVILNQQMICPSCNKNYLFIDGFQLYCFHCKKLFDPYSIDWICIICKKTFNSGVKIYNPLEYFSINFAVKNAIVNNLIIKPLKMDCDCEKNTLKLSFRHNKNCDGVLLEGHIFEKKIVVCKKCKIFASVNKYKWVCPICGIKFKCLQTRSFKEIEDDEFNVEKFNIEKNTNEENLEEKKKKINEFKHENISEKFIKDKIIKNKILHNENNNNNNKNKNSYLNNLEHYKNFFKLKNLEEDKNENLKNEKYHIKRPSKIVENDLQNFNANKEKYEIKRPSKTESNLIENINKINSENDNNNINEKYHIKRPSKLLDKNDDVINKNFKESKSNRYEMNKNINNLFTPVKKKFVLNFYRPNNNKDNNIKLENKNKNNNNNNILSKSGVININEFKKKKFFFDSNENNNKFEENDKNHKNINNKNNEEEEEEEEEKEKENEKKDENFNERLPSKRK